MDKVLLIEETKESLREYLPKLIVACEDVAESIQRNESGWAEVLDQVFEGLDWTVQAVSGIRRLDEQEFANVNVDQLMETLSPLAEALDQMDMVAACDILQFELKDQIEHLASHV